MKNGLRGCVIAQNRIPVVRTRYIKSSIFTVDLWDFVNFSNFFVAFEGPTFSDGWHASLMGVVGLFNDRDC